MIVKFSSDVYENIIMFGDVAKELLAMMGYSNITSGTIKAEEVTVALQHLTSGLETHEGTSVIVDSPENDEAKQKPVSLSHRAFTLIEMLKAAEKEKCSIQWKAQS